MRVSSTSLFVVILIFLYLDLLSSTPKELHKWIKIMLDAYHLNKEDTEIREAKQLTEPIVIQRLFILKDTIEEEYLEKDKSQTDKEDEDDKVDL